MAKPKRGKYYSHVEPRLIEVEGWARDGLIEEQIAKNLGVAYSTFRTYKAKHPALSAALKRSKAIADREVENALFKRAIGYTYKEITREVVRDPETGELAMRVTKEVTKEVQPDTTAQIFWLKNRKPNEWRDKQQTELTGKDGGPIVTKNEGALDFSKLNYEELKALEEIYEKASRAEGD